MHKFTVQTGDLCWEGFAETHREAVEKAFQSGQGTCLGVFFRSESRGAGARWGLTENVLKEMYGKEPPV